MLLLFVFFSNFQILVFLCAVFLLQDQKAFPKMMMQFHIFSIYENKMYIEKSKRKGQQENQKRKQKWMMQIFFMNV